MVSNHEAAAVQYTSPETDGWSAKQLSVGGLADLLAHRVRGLLLVAFNCL
jgi:hypothetical protein